MKKWFKDITKEDVNSFCSFMASWFGVFTGIFGIIHVIMYLCGVESDY